MPAVTVDSGAECFELCAQCVTVTL